MRNALIVVTGYDPEYLRIIEQICLEVSKQNLTPIIFDLSPIMESPTESHSHWVLGLGKIKSTKLMFYEKFAQKKITVTNSKDYINERTELDTQTRNVLEESIQSALYTYFRTDRVNFNKKRVRQTENKLLQEGTLAYNALTNILKHKHFAFAYVPNGRFPVQRMAKLSLEQNKIKVFHFEKGATKNHAYLRPYSPHDRIATQKDVNKVLKGLSKSEIEKIANSWLHSRLPSNNSSNEYSAIWKSKQDDLSETRNSLKQIGFFTSSQDEFLHLGPDWQLHSWSSQFEAFDVLMSHFENKGYECYLRVHPNLSTKEHACFKREIRGLKKILEKHPSVKVYWHDDFASSYNLLEKSEGVVVWDSTIGLEASAKGIPVWNCAVSYYSLIADTREILGLGDISDSKLKPWIVNSNKAKRFIAYFVLRDLPLSTSVDTWVDWDTNKIPLLVKLSTFIRSGGAPTLFDSLLVTIDPWRHRKMRANLKILRSKLKKK